MKTVAAGCLLLWLAGVCLAQDREPLCPRHIETPTYPQFGRTAHLTGKVVLLVTVDENGNVTDAIAANNDKWVAVFKVSAIDNIRHWTFAKPPTAPYTETIVFDYEFDESLPGDDGSNRIIKVTFDLPDRVTILTNLPVIDHT